MLLNNSTDPIVDLTRCNILTDPASTALTFAAPSRYIGPRHTNTSKDDRTLNVLISKMMASIKHELESNSSSASFSTDLEKVLHTKSYVQYNKPSTYLNVNVPKEKFVYTDHILEDDDNFDSVLIYHKLVYDDDTYSVGLSYMPLLDSLENYADNELSMDHILLYDLETGVKTLNPKV